MRALVHVGLAATLATGVVHGDAALAALHEHHEVGHAQHQDHDHQDRKGADFVVGDLLQRADHGRRKAGHDAGEDDQRDAVADAALGDLLAQPHQEDGAGGERDDGGEDEARARRVDHRDAGASALALQRRGDAAGLDDRQHDGADARILGQLAPTALAFLLHRLPGLVDLAHELHDDGSGNVGDDVQREQAEAVQGATGEHVEHVHDGALLLLHQPQHGRRIDTGHRDVAADAVDDQGQDHEDQALAELGELTETTQGTCCGRGLRQGITPSRCRRRLRSRPWRPRSQARP